MSEKTYIFVGEGLGVPGLPHEIGQDEAERRGLTAQLDEAVEAGVYKLRAAARKPKDVETAEDPAVESEE